MPLTVAGRTFRPSLLATVMTIAAVAIMVGLGTWQVQRLTWKTALLDRMEQRLTAPAVSLPPDIDDPGGFDYRRVRVTGRYLHDAEMYLGPRPKSGVPGYHVVTPLLRSDGVAVLVDRGWIPAERRNPETRTDGLVEGPVTVEGIARVPPDRGWLQPDNEPGNNLWFWIEPEAMTTYAGLSEVAPIIVEEGEGGHSGQYPLGGQTRVVLPNNHLQYAVTWYGLALTLIAVYVVYHFRREETEGDADRADGS